MINKFLTLIISWSAGLLAFVFSYSVWTLGTGIAGAPGSGFGYLLAALFTGLAYLIAGLIYWAIQRDNKVVMFVIAGFALLGLPTGVTLFLAVPVVLAAISLWAYRKH